MLEVFPPHAHPLSFIYPSIIQDFPSLSSLLSFSPTRFAQNTFLSLILFPSASYSSHLSSSSSSSLPHSLCLLDISLSLFYFPPPCLYTPFPPLFPLWWMSLSAGCSSYLLSRGAHTVSLSRPPHLYPSTKETEGARGYSGMREGGRPWSRDPLRESLRQQSAWWGTH